MILQKETEQEIHNILADKEEARDFLKMYCAYCEVVDDCIDEPKSAEAIKTLTSMAAFVYNHKYWLKFSSMLSIVDRLIQNQYFDSVSMEHNDAVWAQQTAKFYSHAAMLMIFSIILIEKGPVALESISLKVRQASYERELQS